MNHLRKLAEHCFVCGEKNQEGLKISFRIEAECCVAEHTVGAVHVGWKDIVHGGILYAMLDDVMANWIVLQGYMAFTSHSEIRYRTPLLVNERVRLESRLLKRRGTYIKMQGTIHKQKGNILVAEAQSSFIIQNEGQ